MKIDLIIRLRDVSPISVFGFDQTLNNPRYDTKLLYLKIQISSQIGFPFLNFCV